MIVGPPELAWAVVAVDGQRSVGDVDGDGLSGVHPAEGDLLPGDHDDAGGGGSALETDRFDGWLGWRSGGTGAAQSGDLGRGERVGAGAQQLAGIEVEERQGLRVDTDADPAAAEDRGRQNGVPAETDAAEPVDGAVDLDRPVGPGGRGQGRRPGRAATVTG